MARTSWVIIYFAITHDTPSCSLSRLHKLLVNTFTIKKARTIVARTISIALVSCHLEVSRGFTNILLELSDRIRTTNQDEAQATCSITQNSHQHGR